MIRINLKCLSIAGQCRFASVLLDEQIAEPNQQLGQLMVRNERLSVGGYVGQPVVKLAAIDQFSRNL